MLLSAGPLGRLPRPGQAPSIADRLPSPSPKGGSDQGDPKQMSLLCLVIVVAIVIVIVIVLVIVIVIVIARSARRTSPH